MTCDWSETAFSKRSKNGAGIDDNRLMGSVWKEEVGSNSGQAKAA